MVSEKRNALFIIGLVVLSLTITGAGRVSGETVLVDAGLVPGTNVLAVEVHQRSGTSSDISFDLELIGTKSVTRKAPYLIYNGDNTQMQVLWQLILTDTCAIEWGADTLYSMGSEQTYEYGGDHQHSYTIADLTPGSKYYYRVTVNEDNYPGSFHAAPATNATAVPFLAYGDTRTYPADHDDVAAAVVATYEADEDFQSFILCAGDLVNNGNAESDWDGQFFDPSYANIQELLATLPYQACMGNHEGTGVLFTKYFPYPFVAGRYWSFDWGPAHFVCVDQYTSYGSGSAQLTWIENELATTTKPWKFVYLHEPGWSAGGHGNETPVQDYIQPLCEQYGVSIVFGGHNHYYARAVVNGIQHVTTGGGGAPLRTPDSGYPNIVVATKVHHFCTVELDGDVLEFKAVTSAGAVIDSFTIIPSVRDLEIDVAYSDITLSWTAPVGVPIDHHVVYRNTTPDFVPASGDSIGSTAGTSYVDVGAAKLVSTNYFYVVGAVNTAGYRYKHSNRVGEFDIDLLNAP